MCPSFGQNPEVILYHLTSLLKQEREAEGGPNEQRVVWESLSEGTELGSAVPKP